MWYCAIVQVHRCQQKRFTFEGHLFGSIIAAKKKLTLNTVIPAEILDLSLQYFGVILCENHKIKETHCVVYQYKKEGFLLSLIVCNDYNIRPSSPELEMFPLIHLEETTQNLFTYTKLFCMHFQIQ